MKQKIQKRSTGDCYQSTLDYICGSLPIHYMRVKTKIIELTHLVTVAPHYIYYKWYTVIKYVI